MSLALCVSPRLRIGECKGHDTWCRELSLNQVQDGTKTWAFLLEINGHDMQCCEVNV